MRLGKSISTALIATSSAFVAVAIYHFSGLNKQQVKIIEQTPPIQAVNYAYAKGEVQPVDFRYAASLATPAVVHIKSTYKPERTSSLRGNDPFRDLFGDDFQYFFHGPNPYNSQPQIATGSGDRKSTRLNSSH